MVAAHSAQASKTTCRLFIRALDPYSTTIAFRRPVAIMRFPNPGVVGTGT
jgi:hypothetical protein